MPLPTQDEIEHALEKESNNGILKLNKATITQEKNDILQRLQLSRDELKKMHEALKRYRYISNIKDVILGNYIRWINITDPTDIKLTNGAFAGDFRETDDTIYIVCRTQFNRFFNVDVNRCVIFQKLNPHEETLLAVINYLEK